MLLAPKLQRRVVVRWRIHVEKAHAFGIKGADFIFVNLAGAHLVVEKNRPQLAALKLLVQERCDAASINSMPSLTWLKHAGRSGFTPVTSTTQMRHRPLAVQ